MPLIPSSREKAPQVGESAQVPLPPDTPWALVRTRVDWSWSNFSQHLVYRYGGFIVFEVKGSPREGDIHANRGWGLWLIAARKPVGYFSQRLDAMRVGEALWAIAPLMFKKEEDIGVIREQAPRWVKPWVDVCRAADKYVDHIPYREGKSAKDTPKRPPAGAKPLVAAPVKLGGVLKVSPLRRSP